MQRTVRVAPGVDAPYPDLTSDAATTMGRSNRRVDTRPEIAIRSALHRRGLRFRKDRLVRVEGARSRVDICFPSAKVAVFVDGCFWHCCPEHHVTPRSNSDYWVPKLQANVERDRKVTGCFEAAGWTVIRIWEHEDVEEAAATIEELVRSSPPRPR